MTTADKKLITALKNQLLIQRRNGNELKNIARNHNIEDALLDKINFTPIMNEDMDDVYIARMKIV